MKRSQCLPSLLQPMRKKIDYIKGGHYEGDFGERGELQQDLGVITASSMSVDF